MDDLKADARRSFSILVLADLSGQPIREPPRVKERRLVRVTRESLPVLIAAVRPGFSVPAGGSAKSAERCDVRFLELDAFRREAVLARYARRDLAEAVLNSKVYHGLRSTWCGLSWLVEATSGMANIAVKVLDISKFEILRDLEKAPEFDQSGMFKKVYEEGLQTFGGDPVGAVLADFELSGESPDDLKLTRMLTQTVSASFSLLLSGVTPDFLAVRQWGDLERRFDSRWFRECSARSGWRQLFETEDSRYLALLLPRWRPRSGGAVECEEWIHPGYLAAATIAGAMNAPDLSMIAANLFPGWRDAMGLEAVGAEPTVDLEWECDSDRSADLARIGCAVLPGNGLAEVASASRIARPADSLAHALLGCEVAREIYRNLRRTRHSEHPDSLVAAIEAWACGNVPRDSADQPLLSIEGIDWRPRSTTISISWHAAVGGGSEQIRLAGPGAVSLHVVDESPGAAQRIAVMAFTGPSEPKLPEAESTRWVRGEDRLPFRRKLTLQVADRVRLGESCETPLELQTWDDFEPDSLWRVLASPSGLGALRLDLANIGFYAHVDPRRCEALAEFTRAGALQALVARIQGWRSLLKDPEHGAIDPQAVEATLGGWGFEDDSVDAQITEYLSRYSEWLGHIVDPPRNDSIARLRRELEDMDRLALLELRHVYRLPAFRQHERVCLAARWVAESVPDAKLSVFVFREGFWEVVRGNDEKRRGLVWDLQSLWWPDWDSSDQRMVVVAPEWHPEILELAEEALRDAPWTRKNKRVLIVPIENARPPREVAELGPELAAAAAGSSAASLILAAGEFPLRPARRQGTVALHPFHPASDETLSEDVRASVAYQVAAAVARTSFSADSCTAKALEPALQGFGLTCWPLGEALLVSKES
jgi:predicted component of type VI protein secretion system